MGLFLFALVVLFVLGFGWMKKQEILHVGCISGQSLFFSLTLIALIPQRKSI
jgi:hypothetical protein